MVLADWQIKECILTDHGVDPYDLECINPSSLDLRLGNEFIQLNGNKSNETFQSESLLIEPGDAYLATTVEYIRMPHDVAGALYLKSSLARTGLDHSLAGWVDVGFEGQLTLELHSHRPVELYHRQRIIQLVLYAMSKEPIKLYDGRYRGQTGPTRMIR